ncbi:MAG: 2Fe-2S iron-sulfur cluster-binding protein [Phycisphaerales bacterium]|jgi:NADH-quinone oxidoreductase subunit G|nr:2Fe-2S iron-sulfur cluster-binding protein [Phycisphaerales bacterium]
MATITINGKVCEFTPGQMILQVANANGVAIPQYCYHDGLSIVASCRICLGEVWAPNPRAGNKLEPMMGGKLVPTCQTPAGDGMVVHTDTPKSVANQKAVMEYLLINHPLDCPVCDQAGECLLQDFSYKYGRGVSRFEETKVKQPKKDLGPNVWLYSDRCIMCTRCVRFTREVAGTSELIVEGRGNQEQIDVFPGEPLANELSANVVDLCPVGALLDKDFLFAQRVWFLKRTPTIDGYTASGDNVWAEHNEGRIYRFKPRTNASLNKWWITDEVRYSWKHVASSDRLRSPMRRQYGALVEDDWTRCTDAAVDGLREHLSRASGRPLVCVVSPMLSCEDAYLLASAALAFDPNTVLAIGPVPSIGEDKVFPPGAKRDDPKAFTMYAEKAPNARGVRRVLGAIAASRGGRVIEFAEAQAMLERNEAGAAIVTGNYPSEWASPEFVRACEKPTFLVLIDTLASRLIDEADVVLPGATWLEKAGTFENARNMLQAFEQAIPPLEGAKAEGQIALDLLAALGGRHERTDAMVRVVDEGPGQVPGATTVSVSRGRLFNAADVRAEMSGTQGLEALIPDVKFPSGEGVHEAGMEMVEL